MKCLIIDAVDPCIAEELGKVMEVTTVENYPLTKAELKEIIAPYDVLIMRVDPQIDAELIEAAENLKFIGDGLILQHPHCADLDDLAADMDGQHPLGCVRTRPRLVPLHIQNNIFHVYLS